MAAKLRIRGLIILGILMLSFSCVTQNDIDELNDVNVVEVPSEKLFISIPDNEKYTPSIAIIMLGGGGYASVGAKGILNDWKDIMSKYNIALFSVDYSMPNGNPEVPVKDVLNAYNYIVSNCTEYNVDPSKIGIMGFSAGGHLASLISTKYVEDVDLSFQVLLYPVISMKSGMTHWDSRINFLGNVLEDVAQQYSTNLLVTDDTPPCYIILNDPDEYVPPVNSQLYYDALNQHRIPVEINILNKGQHGWSFSNCPDVGVCGENDRMDN